MLNASLELSCNFLSLLLVFGPALAEEGGETSEDTEEGGDDGEEAPPAAAARCKLFFNVLWRDEETQTATPSVCPLSKTRTKLYGAVNIRVLRWTVAVQYTYTCTDTYTMALDTPL